MLCRSNMTNSVFVVSYFVIFSISSTWECSTVSSNLCPFATSEFTPLWRYRDEHLLPLTAEVVCDSPIWGACLCLRPSAAAAVRRRCLLAPFYQLVHVLLQVAQLSQRDRAAGLVSYCQKWKTGTGKQYFRDYIGLPSTTVIRPENLSNSLKKTQNKGCYGVRGYSRSSRSVSIESPYATFY